MHFELQESTRGSAVSSQLLGKAKRNTVLQYTQWVFQYALAMIVNYEEEIRGS